MWHFDKNTGTYLTEFSDWSGNGRPHPITGKTRAPSDGTGISMNPRYEHGELVAWEGYIDGHRCIIIND